MRDFSSKLPNGVRRLFRLPITRDRALREVDEEMRFHFVMRVAELRALGMSQDDADAEAVRRFGDMDDYRVHVARRAATHLRWYGTRTWAAVLEKIVGDITVAARQARRTPGFAVGIVLIL